MNKSIYKMVLLGAILLLAFFVRLYRIDNPVADWHAWRQADTAAVAKIYQSEGIDLLYPRYFDISNIQSGSDNPEGYRFVEFPIYPALGAAAANTFPLFSLEVWLRLITITSSVAAIYFLKKIVEKNIGEKESYFAAFFYAFLPFAVYYGRVILPDPNMVGAILGGIYFFDKWLKGSRFSFAAALLLTSLALLIKPVAVFFAPIFAYLAFKKFGWRSIKKAHVWIFAGLAALPLILWRAWIANFPEGIPAYAWLLDGGIRFTGAFFYWIFGERIAQLILGYFGIALAALGLLKKEADKGLGITYMFLATSLLYLFIFAGGNVQHDYYQILIIPTLAILLGRGSVFLLNLKGHMNKVLGIAIIVVFTTFTFTLSWYHVRDYFNVNNREMVEAGRTANKLLPSDAKVIAPLDGDTTLLYYVARPGWPAFQDSLENLVEIGATHYLLLNPSEEEVEQLSRDYEVTHRDDSFILLNLKE